MADVAGVNSRRSRYFPTNGDADSDESVYTVDDEEYFSSSEDLGHSDRRRESDRTRPSRTGSDDVVINDRDINFRRSSENLSNWRPSPRTEVELSHPGGDGGEIRDDRAARTVTWVDSVHPD